MTIWDTQTPPTEPLSYEPLPLSKPPMRRFTVLEIVSWVIIIASVSFIAWRASAMQVRLSASNDPDISLPMRAQYALGAHLLYQSNPAGTAQLDNQAIDALDKDAKNPEDKLRVAIFAGELRGTPEALARLHTLAISNPELADDVHTAESLYGDVPVPQDARDHFHRKYQWFSDLLDSRGKTNADPQRAAVEQRSYITIGTVFASLAGVAILGLGGLVLFIIAIIRLLAGRIPLTFPRSEYEGAPPTDRGVYIAGMAVYVGGYVGLSLALRFILTALNLHSDILITILGMGTLSFSFLAGFLLPLFLGQTTYQWRQAFGLTTGRGVFCEMASGVLGYLTGMPLMIAGGIIVLILTQLTQIKGTHPIVEELSGSPWTLLLVFVVACIFAPVTEELMFRGALFSHLRERFNWFISALTMGTIFALMHPQSWVALPVLASIAIVFAGIREWRGSIIGSMTAHALHNGTALALSLLLLR